MERNPIVNNEKQTEELKDSVTDLIDTIRGKK